MEYKIQKTLNTPKNKVERAQERKDKKEQIRNTRLRAKFKSPYRYEERNRQREQLLRRGQRREIKRMIDEYDEGIDDYSFGYNKTLLLEAVIVCPNPKVVGMIMEKEVDIDKENTKLGIMLYFCLRWI